MNCYEVLGVPQNAPLDQIKKRYQELVLKLHPDKRQQATPVAEASRQFMAVQSAWETLRRQKRDQRASDLGLPTTIEVTPEETEFEELQSRFVFKCRCGDAVLFEVEAIEEGVDMYECNTCSLMYRLRLGL